MCSIYLFLFVSVSINVSKVVLRLAAAKRTKTPSETYRELLLAFKDCVAQQTKINPFL